MQPQKAKRPVMASRLQTFRQQERPDIIQNEVVQSRNGIADIAVFIQECGGGEGFRRPVKFGAHIFSSVLFCHRRIPSLSISTAIRRSRFLSSRKSSSDRIRVERERRYSNSMSATRLSMRRFISGERPRMTMAISISESSLKSPRALEP